MELRPPPPPLRPSCKNIGAQIACVFPGGGEYLFKEIDRPALNILLNSEESDESVDELEHVSNYNSYLSQQSIKYILIVLSIEPPIHYQVAPFKSSLPLLKVSFRKFRTMDSLFNFRGGG